MKKDHFSALKRFPIVQFLTKCNLVAVHGQGRELYYLSPLREERTASFAVNTRKNCWFDHGLGEGGNLLDLAMRLWGMSYADAAESLGQAVACPAAYDDADEQGRARNFVPLVAVPGAGRTVLRTGERARACYAPTW
ncbi:CHC2 zinc finger domain-containing protein [Hymenobacter humi]|uniref:CHC2 zinc finger domain-containing protein n=1 Tax=Hymenobacter humi TaxID=1411620 RepID=A0ABW2UCX5_9BACT